MAMTTAINDLLIAAQRECNKQKHSGPRLHITHMKFTIFPSN